MSDRLYDSARIKAQMEELGLNPTQIAAGADRAVPTVYAVLAGSDVRVSTLNAVLQRLGLALKIVGQKEAA